jgi:hypothetical protein
MSEGRQPPPDFDGKRYERPQKNWLCGHTPEGCPCRLGPSPDGACRAGAECRPSLVPSPQPGSPGLWKCTRPAADGGPCPDGPLPDGTCCRLTPPCRPLRSLRARRGLLVRTVLAASFALLLLAIAGPWSGQLLSPGPLTPPHSGPAFAAARPAGATQTADPLGCAHCHPAAHTGPADWTATALALSTGDGPLAPARLIASTARDFAPMDAACQSCHRPHSFHQANIRQELSCSACHLEHQGPDHDLLDVSPSTCVACHGDPAQMHAAATLARTLPHSLFEKRLAHDRTAFPVPRPPEGRTAPITSFSADHPEFRLLSTGARDPNPLAFNHALHLSAATIPTREGAPLDCRSCHVPDASGTLMQPIRFELHCQSCHGLPIDPSTPALTVPHGSAEAARAFLRALPAAYTDDAVRRLGLSGQPLRDHVTTKLAALEKLHPSGEALERKVFFGSPAAPAGRDSCNLCHQVEARPAGASPLIAPTQVPDVWLPHGQFDHARHTQLACVSCHAAPSSIATADVLMPSKATCAACHGPTGGVTDRCTDCHGYHNPPPSGLTLSSPHSAPLPEALRRAIATAP